MLSDVIAVGGVTKTYRLGVGRARIREMIPPPFDRALARLLSEWWNRNCFDALDDVSLTVARGTSVGIVGHNGAGKTTLLKVIAGVTTPTSGSAWTNGKVAALLDVIVGFHPDLTGRENLVLLGGFLGLNRKDVTRLTPRILDFAEIPDAADTPVKRYSAGMLARLGFAALTAIDFDVLLIDEVLAVGDAGFQRKCVDWLDEYRKQGGTLLFVSHNLALIRSMTERVVWLDHGRVVADGETAEILGDYARAMEQRGAGQHPAGKKQVRKLLQSQGGSRWGAGGARVNKVHVDDPADGLLGLTISYEASGTEGDRVCVGILDEAGREIGVATSPALGGRFGTATVRCEMRPVPVRDGVYFPVVVIVSPDGTVRDRWALDKAIVIDSGTRRPEGHEFGAVRFSATWSEVGDEGAEAGDGASAIGSPYV